MAQLMDAGADLTQERHVIFYSYAPSQEAADRMAAESRSRGFIAEVREPMPDSPGEWSCVCEITAVLSPDFVRDTGDFFDDLAARNGADYDGWEASL